MPRSSESKAKVIARRRHVRFTPRADVVSVPDRKNKGRTAGSVREGMERLDMSEKNGPSLGDGTGA